MLDHATHHHHHHHATYTKAEAEAVRHNAPSAVVENFIIGFQRNDKFHKRRRGWRGMGLLGWIVSRTRSPLQHPRRKNLVKRRRDGQVRRRWRLLDIDRANEHIIDRGWKSRLCCKRSTWGLKHLVFKALTSFPGWVGKSIVEYCFLQHYLLV